MKRVFFKRGLRDALVPRNWESGVAGVAVEPCAEDEDPLGWRAVFFLSEVAGQDNSRSFTIGASLLAQREHNLTRAGYRVPMTQRAIDAIEKNSGEKLVPVMA